MTITRTVHGHTVTLRGDTFAVDIVTRPPDHVRAGVQIVIDDDAQGRGVATRLHVYGLTGWRELRALMDMVEKEIEETMMSEEKGT